MIDKNEITHHIQKYILSILLTQKSARFRDMRPKNVDTNLYSYHLKLLLKNELVQKGDAGYELAPKGLMYVDRVSADKFFVREQHKIVTMLVVQNSNGDILLQRRKKQPYIDTWTLPYGKMHIEDKTIVAAAIRETEEKLGISAQPEHAGECYIRVYVNDEIISSTLVHVFRFEHDAITETEDLIWARPHKLAMYELAPAVEKIVARTFFRDTHFFEEYDEIW